MLNCLYSLEAGKRVMAFTNLEMKSLFQRVSEEILKRGLTKLCSMNAEHNLKRKRLPFFCNWEVQWPNPTLGSVWSEIWGFRKLLWEQAGKNGGEEVPASTVTMLNAEHV